MTTTTRTYVLLHLSVSAYNEIKKKLLKAGYEHAVIVNLLDKSQERIDMHGIAVAKKKLR